MTNADDSKCLGCRGTKLKPCQKCGKKIYSGTGKVKCTTCRRVDGELLRSTYNIIKRGALSKVCGDIEEWRRDILLLATKEKWGLLTPVDNFRICHIWLILICDDLRHSKRDPQDQIKLMMADLMILITGDEREKKVVKEKKVTIGRSKKIEQLNEIGDVIMTYNSINEAAEGLDLNRKQITQIIKHGSRKWSYVLRWKV